MFGTVTLPTHKNLKSLLGRGFVYKKLKIEESYLKNALDQIDIKMEEATRAPQNLTFLTEKHLDLKREFDIAELKLQVYETAHNPNLNPMEMRDLLKPLWEELISKGYHLEEESLLLAALSYPTKLTVVGPRLHTPPFETPRKGIALPSTGQIVLGTENFQPHWLKSTSAVMSTRAHSSSTAQSTRFSETSRFPSRSDRSSTQSSYDSEATDYDPLPSATLPHRSHSPLQTFGTKLAESTEASIVGKSPADVSHSKVPPAPKELAGEDDDPPCTTLHVGNIPLNTSIEELIDLFCMEKGYERLLYKRTPHGSLCFIHFESIASARLARNLLWGRRLKGSEDGITLQFSRNPPVGKLVNLEAAEKGIGWYISDS